MTTIETPIRLSLQWNRLLTIILLTSLWVHLSETIRYFLFIMPAMRSSLSGVEGIAPMDFSVFIIWVLWDTLLTGMVVFVYWLYVQRFGKGWRSVLVSASLSWLFFFLLFWIGMYNMGLANGFMLGVGLSLSWVEMVVATCIVARLLERGK